jgi:hypothetical protein
MLSPVLRCDLEPAVQAFYNVKRPAFVGSWTVIGQLQIIFSQ